MTLDLWDTPGNDYSNHLRPVQYPQAQVILISFTVGDPTSLDRVLSKVRIPLAI
jgi:GTPase SAR1 family protein